MYVSLRTGGIVFALSLVSHIFWSSFILLTRVWMGPVSVGLDTIHDVLV